MKITSVQSFAVDPGFRGRTWIFVRVETDTGLHGWGEAYTLRGRDKAIVGMIDELGNAVVGSDPFGIKHFTQVVRDDYAQRRHSFELYCAQSGIEQALWDIVGKECEQPVYNLLGGACRDRVRVYANGWSDNCRTPSDYARAAEKTVAQGFSAIKFSPLPGPYRTHIPRAQEDYVVDIVRAVRNAVGPEVEILFDAVRRLAPYNAIRLGRALEEFSLYWFEEPCSAEDIRALVEVRGSVGIPLVSGEALYGKSAFCPLLEARAADIINPDVCNVGGILELKEIGAMAESCSVAISPHNFNSTTVALASTIQVSAVMPNFLLTEYFLPFADFASQICPEQFKPIDGYIDLPSTPGLGIDFDRAILDPHLGFASGQVKLLSTANEE